MIEKDKRTVVEFELVNPESSRVVCVNPFLELSTDSRGNIGNLHITAEVEDSSVYYYMNDLDNADPNKEL